MITLNSAFKFLIELGALFLVGYWGWHQDIGALRFVLGVLCPVVFAAIWYTFNVRGDPGRSGKAPVQVPGFVRLIIELTLFAMATLAAFAAINAAVGAIFGLAVLIHYVAAYKRISWMLRN
jgi:hypothetical protein